MMIKNLLKTFLGLVFLGGVFVLVYNKLGCCQSVKRDSGFVGSRKSVANSKVVVKSDRSMVRKRKGGGLTKRQEEICSVFDNIDKVTNVDIMKKVKDVSVRTIRRDLAKLEKKGVVRKIGETRGAYYVKA